MPTRNRVTRATIVLLAFALVVSNAFTTSTRRVVNKERILYRSQYQQSSHISVASSTADVTLGKKRLAAGMGFLTGWADMVLNAKLATFCSMMTGNFLWLIKALADWRWRDGFYYASVLAAYAAGLAAYRKCQVKNQQFLPTMAAIVAMLFVAADLFLIRSSNFIYVKLLPACCLSFAFALVNGVGNDTAGTMTFVITGHMTKMITSIVDDRAAEEKSSWKATMQRLLQQNAFRTQLAVFLGFGGGAMFANGLRLNGIVNGQFASIGLLFCGLFLWKDSLTKDVKSFSHAEKSIPDVTETALPTDVTVEFLQDETVMETTLSNTIIDGRAHLDSDLLHSSFAADLIPSQAVPIDSTLDWMATASSFNITTPLSP